jgi:TolA-binding protein
MFADAVERARNDLAGQSYQQGMDKVRVQRWQEAASAFEESLKYKDDSAIGPSVRLGLAESYRHLNRQREAIPILSQLAESAADKEVLDDALYQLAGCQMDVQAWNDAKNAWRTLIRRFPESRFAAEAKLQLAQLNLMH